MAFAKALLVVLILCAVFAGLYTRLRHWRRRRREER